jgi:cytidylate kinase
MNDHISIEKARAFLDSYFADGSAARPRPRAKSLPAVTISRQAGAGGLTVAGLLADLLQKDARRPGVAWTVFDKNLVEFVLDDLHLPARLVSALPEKKVSGIADAIEEFFGLHPASWTMVQKTSETILRLATLGGVILVGRGASIITSGLDNVLHVRLVGSVERRVERLMSRQELSRKAALAQLTREDKGRAGYLKKHFDRDINDHLLYHLIINTDRFDCPETARIIAECLFRNYF